jgi:flagellar biosynthesis protein FlhG
VSRTGEPVEIDDYPEVAEAVAAGFGADADGDEPWDDGGDAPQWATPAQPALGVPAVPESSVAPLASDGVPDDQAASLRRLVAASRPPAPERTPVPAAPVIAIASGKGGVGKSTIALNLAVAAERSCTLVDLDLGTANLDVMCGVSPSRRLDAELFSAGGPDLASVVVRTPFGFGLIPGAAGVAGAANLDAIQRRSLLEAVQHLGDSGEMVIADLGAGIGPSVVETVAASDLGIIVTTPDPAAIADAYAIVKCVVQHRGDPRPLRMGLVVTMAASKSAGRDAHARIDRVCRRFLGGAIPLLGVVRRDEQVVRAARRREPLLARRAVSPAARDLRGLSALVGMLAPRTGRVSVERALP